MAQAESPVQAHVHDSSVTDLRVACGLGLLVTGTDASQANAASVQEVRPGNRAHARSLQANLLVPLEMLKTEESSSVILQQEPLLQGAHTDTARTGTTVLAIETQHDESEAEGEELEYGYPITCGDSTAVLLIKKFVCPGINVRCVKFNNELISPKQFVQLSGKATLKDWKRAIRLGGVMLRKMMDSGQIDFHQHRTVCSNTCRSSKCDVPMSRTMVQLSPPSVTGEDFNDATRTERHSEERSDSPDEVLSLWKSVSESGLMGNVLSNLQTKLLLTFKEIEARGLKDNLQLQDAIILNTLCEMFGLCESVKQAVEQKNHFNEENTINNHFYELNRTLKKRKKLDKASTCKASSSKQPRLLPHGSLNTAPSGQLSDKTIGDGQKVKLKRRLRENSNLRRQGVDEEDRGGREMQREVRQAPVLLRESSRDERGSRKQQLT
ncbi:hypothetical protein WMY93_008587 [Mugilogobius chulae]|uniref:SAND domain-containing protein n=1 Tax=Mugilogobius chulae TaxID=88201 RepID=A0AAW0PL60_9GOBI